MKEEKRNKIIAAVAVNAVLLVFILVAVIIAQIVQISVLNRRKQDLITEYNILLEKKDNAQTIEEQLEVDEGFQNWLLKYLKEHSEDPLGILPDGVIIK